MTKCKYNVLLSSLLSMVFMASCGEQSNPTPVEPQAASSKTSADTAMIIRYPRRESATDERHSYHVNLLREALTLTEAEFGPFKLMPCEEIMNELHMMRKLESGSTDIDVLLRPTSKQDEERLTPIRIPLDKGLLGYRICLVHKDHQDKLKDVKTLDDLKKISIGQGRDWNDVAIYEHNKIPVVTGAVYEGLFDMLLKERFDIFPRGVQEAFIECEQRQQRLPQLAVDQHVLIHYPFVRYAWVAKSEKGELLRKRLLKGFESLRSSGRFEELFQQRYGQDIQKANISKRHVIEIENPFLPDTTPLDRKELWFTP